MRILSEGWARWQPDTRTALLELLRVRHGAGVDAIPPALEQAARLAEATTVRERLREPDLRLVAISAPVAGCRPG